MKKRIKIEQNWKRFWAVLAIVFAIILAFVILLGRCKKENELLKKEVQKIESLRTQIKDLITISDSIKWENTILKSELETCNKHRKYLESELNFQKEEIILLKKQNRGLKDKINSLISKVDSLEKGLFIVELDTPEIGTFPDEVEIDYDERERVVSLDTTSKVSETPCDSAKTDSVPAGSLSVKVVKTSFDKKGNPEKTQELYKRNSELFYSSEKNGFMTDNFGPVSLGNYSTLDKEEIELTLSSLIKENFGAFNLVQVNKETREKTSLVSENKLFPVRAGGLSDKNVWSSHWKGDQFLEKQVDEALKKKGNRRFWGGLAGLAGSSASYAYWVNQPDETRNYVNGKLVSEEGVLRQKQNTWGEGLSILAGAVSTYFIIDGFLDKRASVKLVPCELSIYYDLSPKKDPRK